MVLRQLLKIQAGRLLDCYSAVTGCYACSRSFANERGTALFAVSTRSATKCAAVADLGRSPSLLGSNLLPNERLARSRHYSTDDWLTYYSIQNRHDPCMHHALPRVTSMCEIFRICPIRRTRLTIESSNGNTNDRSCVLCWTCTSWEGRRRTTGAEIPILTEREKARKRQSDSLTVLQDRHPPY